jgi:hypothetical protein
LDPLERFLDLVRSLRPASALEIAAPQADPRTASHHDAWFPHLAHDQYTIAGVAPGAAHDVVRNPHDFPSEWSRRFAAFVAVGVFQHLQRPWIVAREIERILMPGGLCYIATHQTFPLHGYPCDFFRFSKEALSLLMIDAGLEVIDSAYQHRVGLILPEDLVPPSQIQSWNETWPSYLNVHLVARKPG